MTLIVHTIRSQKEVEEMAGFPWRVNRDDPYWVPPSFDDRLGRLDPARNSFWKTAERELWVARRGDVMVGTLGAIIDRARVAALGVQEGSFGFFECLDDREAAQALFNAAEGWLREREMQRVCGPYNPTNQDECGILIDGFNTRPALLEAHNPPYYAGLLGACGYEKHSDLVARLWRRDPGSDFTQQMPGKLARAAEMAARRPDLRVRSLNRRKWRDEIDMAWRISLEALSSLPDNVPVPRSEFVGLAESFRPILDPRMALVAEISGQPVGFVLALPDINEALHKVSRRDRPRKLGPLDLVRLLWLSKRCTRVSYKLLMVRPDYQGRGVESVLSAALARAIWERGCQEVDMSLTGDENLKSNRFQDNLGFRVYRRYRVYQKELWPA